MMCMCGGGGGGGIEYNYSSTETPHLPFFSLTSFFSHLFFFLIGKRGHTWEINMTGGDN